MTTFDVAIVLAWAALALIVALILRSYRADQAHLAALIAAHAPSLEEEAAHRATIAARQAADGMTAAGFGFERPLRRAS